jgi:hypothetical protein
MQRDVNGGPNMDIRSLCSTTKEPLGKQVDVERYGPDVRYFTGQELIHLENTLQITTPN